MGRVRRAMREVDGETIKTRVKEIASANTIEVEVGTNGFRGGNYSHGSRTYFAIKNICGTNLFCEIEDTLVDIPDDEEVAIVLGGDCELMAFIDALKFGVKVLEEQAARTLGKGDSVTRQWFWEG